MQWRNATDRVVGRRMKRALRSVLLGLMYVGALLALPGLVLGMVCDKVVNALDEL